MSSIELIEPATGERLTSVNEATRDDVGQAVRAAEQAFKPWSRMHPLERGKVLLKISTLIRDNLEELAHAESRNVGKPIRDSRDETGLAADCFEYYGGATNKIFGQTIPTNPNGMLMTFREPVGVCGIIVPWNFPIAITSWKVSPAL